MTFRAMALLFSALPSGLESEILMPPRRRSQSSRYSRFPRRTRQPRSRTDPQIDQSDQDLLSCRTREPKVRGLDLEFLLGSLA